MSNEEFLPIGTMIRLDEIELSRLDFLREAGMECCQLCRIYDEHMSGEAGKRKTEELEEALAKNHLSVPTIFFSFAGQKWTPDECGITPEKHRALRMLQAARQMRWAKRFGARYCVCHAGHFPDFDTPSYEKWIADLREFCYLAGEDGMFFSFETGPESAATLARTLEDLDMPNAAINFDPANLLMYNRTDPKEFLDRLGKFVRSVHCKDGRRPSAGETFGKETPLGKGDTHFPERMKQLFNLGFRGPLIIEREILPGPEQDADILSAVALLKELRKTVTV